MTCGQRHPHDAMWDHRRRESERVRVCEVSGRQVTGERGREVCVRACVWLVSDR
jgi:hypothetical protein